MDRLSMAKHDFIQSKDGMSLEAEGLYLQSHSFLFVIFSKLVHPILDPSGFHPHKRGTNLSLPIQVLVLQVMSALSSMIRLWLRKNMILLAFNSSNQSPGLVTAQ